MRWENICFAVAGLMMVLLVGMPGSAEAVQVATFEELEVAFQDLGDDFFAIGGLDPVVTTINGRQISMERDLSSGRILLIDVTDINNQILIYSDTTNGASMLEALRKYLGIALTATNSVALPLSAAATTTRLVYGELTVPAVAPKAEQKRKAAQLQRGRVRTFGGKLGMEWIDVKDGSDEGDIYNFSIGLAQDVEDYSFGVIVPYDHLDFGLFEAQRIGAILFGQYHHPWTDEIRTSMTTNLNYMYTDLDFDGGDDKFNTYGGGLSAGLHYVQEGYEVGLGLSWQYNEDDLDLEDDHQYLVKAGGILGLHLSQEQVLNLFGIWNKDVTDYHSPSHDDEYFEIGTEYRANFGEVWSLSGGYKKVVSLDDYDSDMVYVGSLWLF